MSARAALLALLASLLVPLGPTGHVRAQESVCWCFSWVHGEDYGTTCRNTEAACVTAGRATTRDHSPCTQRFVGGLCADQVNGQRVRREN